MKKLFKRLAFSLLNNLRGERPMDNPAPDSKEFMRKIRAIMESSDVRPEESLYWNAENTDNAGFILPLERCSENPELYHIANELIESRHSLMQVIFSSEKRNVYIPEKPFAIGFFPVKWEAFFGCKNMKELYGHYLTIFEGKLEFEIFCEIFKDYLEDRNGVLSMKCSYPPHRFDFSGWQWEKRRFVIYDTEPDSAKILMAIPKPIDDPASEYSKVYRFVSMRMVKIGAGWRLTDSCFFVV